MRKYFVKKILILAILFIITCMLTGCWNRIELNTLGITLALAIDKENDDTIVTAEVIRPQRGENGNGGTGKNTPVKYIQGTGKTVYEALNNITYKFDRKIFLAHDKVIILSEDIVKSAMSDILDFTQREHEFRETTYFLVSKQGKAEDILGTLGGIESIPSISIEEIMKNQKTNGKAVSIQGFQYYRTLLTEGIQPVLGVIQVLPKHKFRTSDEDKEEYEANTDGAAVMKDNKFVGYLNGTQTFGYNCITNHVSNGVITSQIPNKEGKFTVEILSSRCDNSVILQGGKYNIFINFYLKGMIQDTTGYINANNPVEIEKLEKANSEDLKKIIKEAIGITQKEYKTDIFGFGKLVHQKYPKEWKRTKMDWDKLFTEAIVTVKVKTEISKTGFITIDADTIKESRDNE